jgi:hypothetical protein
VNADFHKNGVQIANIDAQRREAALHASGKLSGSIDNLVDSRPELSLILRGPISELADLDKSLASLGGEVLADLNTVPAQWDKTAKLYHSAREVLKPLVENEIANVRAEADRFAAQVRTHAVARAHAGFARAV